MRCRYAITFYKDDDATLGDLREAVTTLEDAERISHRARTLASDNHAD